MSVAVAVRHRLGDFALDSAFESQGRLTAIFGAYAEEPRQLPWEIQERMTQGPNSPQRVMCDYIAGMTDRYAIQEYKRLFDPEARA